MKYAKTFKKVKRVYRKTKNTLDRVQRHPVTRGLAKMGKLYSDVMLLKHLVNVEKKRFDVAITATVGIGQLTTAGVSGQFATIITPTPAQGTSNNNRIGHSIKIVSGCLDIKFSQQSATVNDLKLRWTIVCKPDNNSNPSAQTSIAQFYEANPFSTVNDYYSSRDPEYFTSFKVIKTGTVNLAQDQIASGQSIKQLKIPLKFDHHLKFNADGTTVTTKNQFYLFVTCSDGDTATFTGALMLYSMRWYYTDN